MPTTRSQTQTGKPPSENAAAKPQPKRALASKKQAKKHAETQAGDQPEVGAKRKVEEVEADAHQNGEATEPPGKKTKEDDETATEKENHKAADSNHPAKHTSQTGTIERGHIYFFYRPRVELEEVHSVDDVQRFHILLVPRPPEFAASNGSKNDPADENGEMNLISEGSDAVPAPEPTDTKKKHFRLIAVGKKQLPDPDAGGGGKGGGRKATFWATVVTVGEDLQKLQDGLGAKEYETKTRGTRHQGPARLAARGAYAIVNTQKGPPSSRETHLGYHLSHPSPDNFGEVQQALGIHEASSFVIQVKNPDAPNTAGARAGLSGSRKAEFSQEIMKEVFGAGGSKGREDFGLRFAAVERRDMLDYEGAELLLIAARSGEEGLETSLGEGRGEALTEVEHQEGHASVNHVLNELAMDAEKIPAEPLEGEWA